MKAYLEDLVKRTNIGDVYVEIYKNPTSISRMQPWMRGVILPSGDLFVCDIEDDSGNANQIIHSDIISWMRRNIIGFNSSYGEGDNPLDYLTEFITVDRSDNTNTFVLAESYDLDEVEESIDDFQYYVKNFKIKNPTLELVIESINEV